MIPTRIHGIIDYVVALILIAAPFVLGFADGTAAQWVPIIVGVLTIALSLLTRYEFGAIRVIPMVGHLGVTWRRACCCCSRPGCSASLTASGGHMFSSACFTS